jgi:hypothetical protein
MNTTTIKNIGRITATAAIAGILALGVQTAFTATTAAAATTVSAHTTVLADGTGTSSNPWEG